MAIDAPSHPVRTPFGDACASCGAAQAADQRYCLECGARRPGLTPLYLQTPAPAVGAPRSVATDVEPPASGPVVSHGPTTALAVIGCLLLAMGVGVLIGRSGNRAARTAPAPAQVINVSAPGADAGATAPAAGATAPVASPASAPSAKRSPAATATGPKGAPAAPSQAIKALQNSTGKQYVQRSKNLPNTTTTGGKPPPVDRKPAGAGSGSVTIG